MDYHYWPTPMMMLTWKVKMEKHWCIPRKGADEMDICPTSMTLKYLQVLSKLRITRDIYSHILTSLYILYVTFQHIVAPCCVAAWCVLLTFLKRHQKSQEVFPCALFSFSLQKADHQFVLILSFLNLNLISNLVALRLPTTYDNHPTQSHPSPYIAMKTTSPLKI